MAASVTSLVPENQRPSARCDETSFIAIAVAESPLVPKISLGGAFVGDATKTNAFVGAAVMGLGEAGEFVGCTAGLGDIVAAAMAFVGAAMAAGLGVEAAAAGEFVDIAAAARDSAWSTSFLTLGSSTSSLTIG